MSIKEFLQKYRVAVTVVLTVILTVALCVTVWAIWLRNDSDNAHLTPDYPPHSIDTNQTPIDNDNTQKLPASTGGGAINVTYAKEAQISRSSGKVSLYYANPNASNQNVAVSIMIGDKVIAKSGIITPGNMLTEMYLEKGIADILSVGGYNATLVIRAYHPQTNEKAMVDTNAELIVEVVE